MKNQKKDNKASAGRKPFDFEAQVRCFKKFADAVRNNPGICKELADYAIDKNFIALKLLIAENQIAMLNELAELQRQRIDALNQLMVTRLRMRDQGMS